LTTISKGVKKIKRRKKPWLRPLVQRTHVHVPFDKVKTKTGKVSLQGVEEIKR